MIYRFKPEMQSISNFQEKMFVEAYLGVWY